ncbi:MAG: 4-alpha-glucanotransferase, partial [Muribaculaceae bacterium]|nr:4-alpha-glucanotransferase [Muribaculaceae bacterium]
VLAGLRMRNPFHWKGAGVAIPVFALRSNDDFGVGDFYDLKKMIDWAAATGQRFVQILPINDTTMTHTWMDSYPYNANSTFALHPMYLRLSELGTLADKKRRAHYEALGKELNALEQIDYERVNAGKIAFFHEIFAQEGADTLASADYKSFLEANRSWLLPYAAFCVLRDRFGTPDFTQWPDGFDRYDAARIERFAADNAADMDYVCYLQYHLDKQMRHVAAYARERGVAIKGDIPIGISRTSADAWQSPELFNMDSQAGAPPDDFSVLGQNWGFPTYNWEVMARDGYAWWKARFSKMSEYFDAYRIDHVLGFFRIWQIPMDAIHGLLGIFNPALPFTSDELCSGYDFRINPDLHTRPYIMDWFLGDFFGELTDRVRNEYLVAEGYGRYRLKSEVDTQRKVADLFAGAADDASKRIRDGLMGLIDNVLFIEDPVERGKYHPRISAQHSYVYRSLNDYEKWCFDRLYNDFFYRRHDAFWHEKAMQKLPPLTGATDMLVCAEDLGMIPHCVPSVMHELEILSLEIQRMPKDPNTEFGNTAAYPYFSVCTTSTHDMGGIRQWWEEDRAATQRFYNQVLHESGQAPYFAEPWVCERIVRRHLESPSMLCILPWQDWMSIDGDLRRHDPREEQINVPANSRHYWRYRMHMKLEDLLLCDSLNDI